MSATASQVRELPIIFSAPMVRAILAGKKTQTRRIVKLPANVNSKTLHHWAWEGRSGDYGEYGCKHGFVPLNKSGGIATRAFHSHHIECPYGRPGDVLWVRETFQIGGYFSVMESANGRYPGRNVLVYAADQVPPWGLSAKPWRSPIHMPRRFSRITLEITDVRVQRVQDISEEDAIAEGVTNDVDACVPDWAALWDRINGKGSWDSNPWVWAITFKRVEDQR